MGLFDKIKELTRPYAEDEYEEEQEQEDEVETIRTRPVSRPATTVEFPNASNKVVNIHATTQLSVVLVKPERFDAAAEIADNLREKRTVVLNLESTAKEVSRRLLDFLSGVAYANDGKIKKVANATYIITPFNVEILGDLIDELENNGLYF